MGKHRPHPSVFGPRMERIGYVLQPSLRVEQVWSVTPRYHCILNYYNSKLAVKTGVVTTDGVVREVLKKFLLLFRVPLLDISYTLPVQIVFLKPLSDEMHAKYFGLIKQYSSLGWTVNMAEPWDCSDAECDRYSTEEEPCVENEPSADSEILDNSLWLDEELESEIHRIYDEHFTCTAEPSRKSNFFFDASGEWCEVMEEGCYKPDPGSTSDWEFEKCGQASFF